VESGGRLVKGLTIAIDGPAGSGKSTAARRVAELLGYEYIDTGAMYRVAALAALADQIPFDDNRRLAELAERCRIELRWADGRTRVWLNRAEVTEEIRRPEVAQAASRVATVSELRAVLVRKQRELGVGGGVVMEGRDIGTVVLPQADLKVFLTASAEVRVRRRLEELAERGERASFERVSQEVNERDRRDTERAASPLALATDAVLIDSTAMEPEEVARLVFLLAREKQESC
jgi:cytidylate kinase